MAYCFIYQKQMDHLELNFITHVHIHTFHIKDLIVGLI